MVSVTKHFVQRWRFDGFRFPTQPVEKFNHSNVLITEQELVMQKVQFKTVKTFHGQKREIGLEAGPMKT